MGAVAVLGIVAGIALLANKARGLKNINFELDGIPELWKMTLTQSQWRVALRATNASSVTITLKDFFCSFGYQGTEFAFNTQKIPEIVIESRFSNVIKLDFTIQNLSLIKTIALMRANAQSPDPKISKKAYVITVKAVYNLGAVSDTQNLEIDIKDQIDQLTGFLGL